VHAQQTLNFSSVAESQYIPRGRNELHRIFEQHFSDFCSEYDMKYATDYGKFRLQRIESVGEKFYYLWRLSTRNRTHPLPEQRMRLRLFQTIFMQRVLSLPILQSETDITAF
jgi:hypothetical protein